MGLINRVAAIVAAATMTGVTCADGIHWIIQSNETPPVTLEVDHDDLPVDFQPAVLDGYIDRVTGVVWSARYRLAGGSTVAPDTLPFDGSDLFPIGWVDDVEWDDGAFVLAAGDRRRKVVSGFVKFEEILDTDGTTVLATNAGGLPGDPVYLQHIPLGVTDELCPAVPPQWRLEPVTTAVGQPAFQFAQRFAKFPEFDAPGFQPSQHWMSVNGLHMEMAAITDYDSAIVSYSPPMVMPLQDHPFAMENDTLVYPPVGLNLRPARLARPVAGDTGLRNPGTYPTAIDYGVGAWVDNCNACELGDTTISSAFMSLEPLRRNEGWLLLEASEEDYYCTVPWSGHHPIRPSQWKQWRKLNGTGTAGRSGGSKLLPKIVPQWCADGAIAVKDAAIGTVKWVVSHARTVGPHYRPYVDFGPRFIPPAAPSYTKDPVVPADLVRPACPDLEPLACVGDVYLFVTEDTFDKYTAGDLPYEELTFWGFEYNFLIHPSFPVYTNGFEYRGVRYKVMALDTSGNCWNEAYVTNPLNRTKLVVGPNETLHPTKAPLGHDPADVTPF